MPYKDVALSRNSLIECMCAVICSNEENLIMCCNVLCGLNAMICMGGTSNFCYMYLHGSESLDSVDFKSKVQFSKQKKELFLLMCLPAHQDK